jgi:hypothetical protein
MWSQARDAARGAAGVHHGRQRLVLDLDQFGRILRLRQGLGHDQRDRIAHVAHAPPRQHRPRCVGARRAIDVGYRD